SFPPGFVPPNAERTEQEYGAYEFRFTSDRPQIQNRFALTVHRAERTTELHLVTTNFLEATPGTSSASLPAGFLRITTPGWQLGLLDQTVNNSPLTVNQTILRGLHLQIGQWTVHLGYSPLATFEDFLIPTMREAAGGIGYTERLSSTSQLTEDFYYFPSHLRPA